MCKWVDAERFEVGKYYEHKGGLKLSIVGEIDTTAYGRCLVGEESDGSLRPVGSAPENAWGCREISKEEWEALFGKSLEESDNPKPEREGTEGSEEEISC